MGFKISNEIIQYQGKSFDRAQATKKGGILYPKHVGCPRILEEISEEDKEQLTASLQQKVINDEK